MNKRLSWMFFAGIALLLAAVISSFFLNGVKQGDTVKVDYALRLEDGTVYYTTAESSPLRFTLGNGVLLPDFEEALVGMHPGETKALTIPAERAYGPYRSDLVRVIARDQLPDGVEPMVGQQFDAQLLNGFPTLAVITAVTDKTITLDANHPLAGQNLHFDIKLVSIEGSGVTADRMRMIVVGIILLVGIGSFAFFNSRNRRRGVFILWPELPQRAVSASHRKR